MRLYVEIAKRSFQRQLAYRTATLAGLTTNAFFGALRSFLFIGLYQGHAVAGGWDVRDAIDYVWLAQALIMPLYLWSWTELAQTIRTGDVVADLTKPVDFYGVWLGRDLGRAIYHTLFRAVPTLAMGVLLFGVRLPPDAGRWLVILLSLALAVWVSFGLRYLTNLAAFWLLDHRGPVAALSTAATFLSGFLIPLNYWPDWARPTLAWLPFAAMAQTPIEVALGKVAGPDLAGALAVQLAWGLALLVLGRWLLTAAERKVIVQGG
jgi:ABC-2 type transport system permease protein